jgi:hypothetical protein
MDLTQVLNRLKVSRTVFVPLMAQQFPEEARHFPNPMSMALMHMKMPTGKPVWQRLRVLRKYQNRTA